MRPGALARLGLDYADVAARNPGLVYAHAQGFRGDSDRAGNAAYDETVQAASGLVDMANRALGRPVYLPTIIGDKVSVADHRLHACSPRWCTGAPPVPASTSRSR